MKQLDNFNSFCNKIINHPLINNKVNESNDDRISYWDGNGKYQKEYDRLWKELVSSSGDSDTEEGELIRAIGRLFHEYCNNGNCNAAEKETEYETCWECGGDGVIGEDDEDCYNCGGNGTEEIDGELQMDEFYENFLDLIEDKVGCTEEVNAVKDLILNNSLHYNYNYSQKEMDVYNKLTDKVVEYVLKQTK